MNETTSTPAGGQDEPEQPEREPCTVAPRWQRARSIPELARMVEDDNRRTQVWGRVR